MSGPANTPEIKDIVMAWTKVVNPEEFSPPLDPGIEQAVRILRAAGVETFESCEGGAGHAYPVPTVRFHGDRSEGFRALAAAMQSGFQVAELRRIWPVIDGEPTGPWWELTFGKQRTVRT
jgi:hypothetical protein